VGSGSGFCKQSNAPAAALAEAGKVVLADAWEPECPEGNVVLAEPPRKLDVWELVGPGVTALIVDAWVAVALAVAALVVTTTGAFCAAALDFPALLLLPPVAILLLTPAVLFEPPNVPLQTS
jgi:hypothetical protein